MKNLFLSAAIVLGSLTSFASTSPISNTIVKTISIQDEYTEIKVEEVPAAVTGALKKAYPDAILSKAYKNAASQYKLEVTVGDKWVLCMLMQTVLGLKNNQLTTKDYHYEKVNLIGSNPVGRAVNAGRSY